MARKFTLRRRDLKDYHSTTYMAHPELEEDIEILGSNQQRIEGHIGDLLLDSTALQKDGVQNLNDIAGSFVAKLFSGVYEFNSDTLPVHIPPNHDAYVELIETLFHATVLLPAYERIDYLGAALDHVVSDSQQQGIDYKLIPHFISGILAPHLFELTPQGVKHAMKYLSQVQRGKNTAKLLASAMDCFGLPECDVIATFEQDVNGTDRGVHASKVLKEFNLQVPEDIKPGINAMGVSISPYLTRKLLFKFPGGLSPIGYTTLSS